MAIQQQGFSGTVAEVEATTRASRVTQRPIDYGTLGAYSLALTSGVMGAGLAAGSTVFSFRWTDATRLCVLRSIKLTGAGGIAAFAAGAVVFEAVLARSFTVSDATGTAATLTGNNNKRRTSFGTSLLADARIASSLALGAGTRTVDNNPFASLVGAVPATAGSILMPPTMLWARDTGDEYPIVLAANEGFIIRATVPATGTWTFGVQTEWGELTSY